MPRRRRPRLSWFRFFPDDWWGGIRSLSVPDTGALLLLILDQWASGDLQAIDPEPERIRLMLRGMDPSPAVLAKFEEVDVGGRKFLRNKRIAKEWADSKREYEGKAKGGGKRADTAPETVPDTVPEPQPQPQPEEVQKAAATAHAREPRPRKLRLDTADGQTELTIRKLQNELGSKLAALAEHENSRLMVPDWCKRVTAWKHGEGVSDYRMVRSIDRLRKSISDAAWWMDKMVKGRVVNSGQRR